MNAELAIAGYWSTPPAIDLLRQHTLGRASLSLSLLISFSSLSVSPLPDITDVDRAALPNGLRPIVSEPHDHRTFLLPVLLEVSGLPPLPFLRAIEKALYGLKQAPRAWNSRIDKHLQEKGFIKCPYEHALYIQSKDKDVLIACLYVDDLIFTGSNPSMFGEFKEVMTKEFEMTDIGLMAYYLGIEVNQREDGSFISQAGYAREILKKFRMDNRGGQKREEQVFWRLGFPTARGEKGGGGNSFLQWEAARERRRRDGVLGGSFSGHRHHKKRCLSCLTASYYLPHIDDA
ncbi:hypothetical protein ZIOFF_071248 [Zingiber officinale]|uniref:Reverse transcriptase Ty1/copia-type domain-containing protein n=1 Tax=Zingiber officinale TaxID=94328 RepID=A0A8J5ETH1_ZINOF|nr:hypothetical protein ZIOFF_071248 [Zingiber officinale]